MDEQKKVNLLKLGSRSLFFDVKDAKNGSKYLRITESRFVKEGEDRKRNTIILFADDLDKFMDKMREVLEELK